MKLDDLVNSHLQVLNETDLIVWRYISAHRKECCYISIYEIAENCNVSRTTVLRFAKKLGLDGFSDLKMLLKMENSQTREKPTIDLATAASSMCHELGEEIAKQNFLYANRLIYKARRVFVYSSGHVQRNIANEMTRLFLMAEEYFIDIEGRDEMQKVIAHATEEDLFIIISLSGETEHVVDYAQRLRARGVPMISITRLKSNSLSRLATESMYVTVCNLPTANKEYVTYESMLGFFLLVEVWFLSYTQFLDEQDTGKRLWHVQ